MTLIACTSFARNGSQQTCLKALHQASLPKDATFQPQNPTIPDNGRGQQGRGVIETQPFSVTLLRLDPITAPLAITCILVVQENA